MSEYLDEDLGAIAIIGMAGRFPGAKNIDEYWRLLVEGRTGIQPVTAEMLREAGLDAASTRSSAYVPKAAWIDDEDCFDANFFGMAPRDAEEMDPQQRVLLECAYHALESAGYAPRSVRVPTGVYVGIKLPTYYLNNLQPDLNPLHSLADMKVQVAADKSYAASRIAHALNLKGPAVSLDTACSTSLVCVHSACRALLNDECDMAIAGGANINVPQRVGYWYQEGGIQSPDGKCKAFDADAAGTVFGNGVGLVVLKRLEDAIHDCDPVLAVIRGSAINNDGANKVGFWAPGVTGQSEVIRIAQQVADVQPSDITFIEAHGTGTALGDPIEVSALKEVFAGVPADQCALASVKSNIGHLEVAAGIASLIKMVLCLQHKTIPATLNYQRPNPKIDFKNTPFYINTECHEWQPSDNGRYVGAVSSFGLGGTNAHLIVEAASPCRNLRREQKTYLWPVSANSASAAARYTKSLSTDPAMQHLAPDRVAWTLQSARERFPWRGYCLAREDGTGANIIEHYPVRAVSGYSEPRVAFLFPGQSSQYPGMAYGLYQEYPQFRQYLDECFDLLRGMLDIDPKLIWQHTENLHEHPLYQTRYAQPLLFSVEYATARLWQALGVEPRLMLGHSLGEFAAATIAGIFRLSDVLSILVLRGELCESSAPGAMVSVATDIKTAKELAGDIADIAAINTEQLHVLGVPEEDYAALCQRLDTAGVSWRRLRTTRAFHSRLLQPFIGKLQAALEQIQLRPPMLPLVSNVTGEILTLEEATDPAYWARHLLQPVQFAAGMNYLKNASINCILEVGPGNVMSQLAKLNGFNADQCISSCPPFAEQQQSDISQADILHSNKQLGLQDAQTITRAMGQLWQMGVELKWSALYHTAHSLKSNEPKLPHRINVTPYPFERSRHWRAAKATSTGNQQSAMPLRPQVQAESWQRLVLSAQAPASMERQRWLVFHDTLGYSADLAYRLRAEGARVIDVYDNRVHAMSGVDAHCIDPEQPDDFIILMQQLCDKALLPHGIVFAWGLSESTADTDLPFNALAYLGRALQQLKTPLSHTQLDQDGEHYQQARKAQLLLINNHTAEVMGHEQICPCKSMLDAAAQVIAHEQQLDFCSIDINLPDEDERQIGGRRRLTIDQIMRVIASLPNDDAWLMPVAVRGRHCWQREFHTAPRAMKSQLRHDGRYLITGGASGIGLCFAEYLASKAADATLFLLGRRSEQHPQVQRALQSLCTKIDKVYYYQCDVTDAAAFMGLLYQIRTEHGDIHGIMHSAGTGLLPHMEEVATDFYRSAKQSSVLPPKITGSRCLLESVKHQDETDWVLLNSSLLALGVLRGQHEYAAANRYMDAVAAVAHHYHLPFCAINWDAWSDVGMISDALSTVVPQEHSASVETASKYHPLLGQEIAPGLYEQSISASHWLFSEHRILKQKVMPGTAWLELAWALAAALMPQDKHENLSTYSKAELPAGILVRSLEILTPLVVSTLESVKLCTRVNEVRQNYWQVTIFSVNGDKKQNHCRFNLSTDQNEHLNVDLNTDERVYLNALSVSETAEEQALNWAPETLPGFSQFKPFEMIDYALFGSRWHALKECRGDDQQVWSTYQFDSSLTSELELYYSHPGLVDLACGIVNGAALIHRIASIGQSHGGIYLPHSISEVRWFASLPAEFESHCRLISQSSLHLLLDIDLRDASGVLLLSVRRLKLVLVDRSALGSILNSATLTGVDEQQQNVEQQQQVNSEILPGMINRRIAGDLFEQILATACSHEPTQLAVCAGTVEDRLLAWRTALQNTQVRVLHQQQSTRHSHAVGDKGADQNAWLYSENTASVSRGDAPQGNIEEFIANLWCELIGVEKVSRHDNFFELGGHSLMATQMMAQLREHYAIEVPFEALFEEPTVAAMSALVQARLWAIRGASATVSSQKGTAREEGVL